MPSFQIQHEVHSLAEIFEPLEFRGYICKIWKDGENDPYNSKKLLVEKCLNADSFSAAISRFRENLDDVVNRISFISQCYMDYEHGSFLIRKMSPQFEPFFFRHIFPVSGVGLHLERPEYESFQSIETFEPPGNLFGYLREATNASTEATMFMMLIGALEAIAGERRNNSGRRSTNTAYIRDKILGPELFDHVYAYGTGVRNEVFHGRSVDLTPRDGHFLDVNVEIYTCIRAYLMRMHGLKLNLNALNTPRTPFNNFNIWQGWLVPRKKEGFRPITGYGAAVVRRVRDRRQRYSQITITL